MSNNTNSSLDTLISISGTIAGIALALVGILSSKSAITRIETLADDVFLFASIGHLLVVVIGYIAQRNSEKSYDRKLILLAEKIFSVSLIAVVVGAFIMVYTEF